MRVLLVHPHDVWSSQEPWTIRVLELARALHTLGHETQVAYFPRTDEVRPRPEVWCGVPLTALDRRAHPLTLIRNTARLWRLAVSVDLLHVQKPFHWAAIPTLVAGWLRRKPVHYDWDDWEEAIYKVSAQPPSPVIAAWLRLLERWVSQLAHTVSVASERLRHEAIARGVSAERISWVPVGADPERFHPDVCADAVRQQWNTNGATVLYVGQLHGGQYVELVLRASACIQAQRPHARVLIVGDGYQRVRLEQLAREWQLTAVTFVGTVPHEDVPAYVAAADVCLAAFEANAVTACKSPLKVVEYLAGGKAIVASDVGEVSRLVGDAGRLVPSGSSEHLAEAVIELLDDPAQRRMLGERGRERALHQFTWQHAARRLEQAYARACVVTT